MALDVAELLAHQPHHIEAAALQHLHDVAVLLAAALAQFAHLADDGHLRTYRHLAEVVERGLHRRRIGVVGIHNQVVAPRLHQLRAVVRRHVVLQRVANLFRLHGKLQSHGDGCQHVVQVVGTDEVCAHLIPLLLLAALLQVKPVLAPAQSQVGRSCPVAFGSP